MRYLFVLLLSIVLFVPIAQAQESRTISITAEGEVQLPADIIRFNINLNATADSPQEAYDLHTKQEKVLVQLLNKYDISEKDIRFQPISIHKSYQNDYPRPQTEEQQQPVYNTNQQVSLKLEDFGVYENIQITLIENGFDNFNGQFRSTEQESGEDEALRNAIREARAKAELIADESGVKLGSIQQITYNHGQYRPMARQNVMAMESDQSSLMEFEQTVVVQASVTINFNIE